MPPWGPHPRSPPSGPHLWNPPPGPPRTEPGTPKHFGSPHRPANSKGHRGPLWVSLGAPAASVSWGVGVLLAASSACVGGGACCVACVPPPPPWPFATAPWLSPHWQSTNVLPPCTVSPGRRTAPTFAAPPFHRPHHLPFSHPMWVRYPQWRACACTPPPLLPLTRPLAPSPLLASPFSVLRPLLLPPPPLPCGLPLALRWRLLLWRLWHVRVHLLRLLCGARGGARARRERGGAGLAGPLVLAHPSLIIRLEVRSRRRGGRLAFPRFDGGWRKGPPCSQVWRSCRPPPMGLMVAVASPTSPTSR